MTDRRKEPTGFQRFILEFPVHVESEISARICWFFGHDWKSGQWKPVSPYEDRRATHFRKVECTRCRDSFTEHHFSDCGEAPIAK